MQMCKIEIVTSCIDFLLASNNNHSFALLWFKLIVCLIEGHSELYTFNIHFVSRVE